MNFNKMIMGRFTGLIFLVLIASMRVNAQGDKLTEARNALIANDLIKAKSLIDEAVEDPKLAGNYQTWYWKGTIYKEIYKNDEKGKVYDSKNRMEAIEAYQVALQDRSKVNTDSADGIMKSLKYLASTLYNDAVVQLDTVNYEQAVKNYEKYSEVTKFVNETADLREQDIKFRMKLATIYVSLYESNANSEKGESYFENAKREYSEIIELNKQHLSANYNMGILFYNKAVHIIQSMEYDIDIEELSKKEEVCVELFLMALPYVKTAYDLDPKRKETLISLKGIYYSLNDQEKYEFYRKELESLTN